MKNRNIKIYDSTLRDGAQTKGVVFSFEDKLKISQKLDDFGVDYIEGGWPGANPTDDKFFRNINKLKKSKLVAFGMTRKNGKSAHNDPGLNTVLNSGAPIACIVGKTWDFHVKKALQVSLENNLSMIHDTIAYSSKRLDEVMFDAEHFFDGYKANKDYAKKTIKAALDGGAKWIILCDTNGGTLPFELADILKDIINIVPGDRLGVHFHNDTDNATANSLEAVRHGVCQVQGTFNGLGERCGNVNLVNVISNLCLKMNYKTNVKKNLKKMTSLSRFIDETLNRPSNSNLPFVGSAAFAHKGGLHISAVQKDPKSYEHINPESLGNQRVLVVSNQSGKSNIINQLKKIKVSYGDDDKKLLNFIELIKNQEFLGYAYDGAEASFELLAIREFTKFKEFYKLESFKVSDERRKNSEGNYITISEARIKIFVKGKEFFYASEGNGPIHALDKALRQALSHSYPQLKKLNLIDYKVRILTPHDGTKALVRVRIESSNGNFRWSTIGVSENVIDASFIALHDSITYHLIKN
ncbi:citramalate synthase [Rickettsiales bacterium]|nr:citramalate synthase [Rickettsiales bacterium]